MSEFNREQGPGAGVSTTSETGDEQCPTVKRVMEHEELANSETGKKEQTGSRRL